MFRIINNNISLISHYPSRIFWTANNLKFFCSSQSCKNNKQTTIYDDIANTLRIDSIKAIHVTKTGHPTSCASIAEIISILFFHQKGLKFHYNNTSHFLNDRLVLSKGHAAPILYSALYRSKVITNAQLLTLRLKNSLLQGHPVPSIPFVDVATGSLGQGLSAAAGMAYSSKYLDSIGNRMYCITGDGEMAEGNIWEAVDFCQKYQLNNLTLFLDLNRLGQSQQTMHGHNAEIFKNKFTSFGWNALVVDGHSVSQILIALQSAKKQLTKPTVIICKTLKGKNLGSNIQNRQDWHGKDTGDNTQQIIKNLKSLITRKQLQFKTYAPQGQQPAEQKKRVTIIPQYKKQEKISTRKAYGDALVKARQSNKNIIALDADTKNSTFSINLHQKYPQNFIECFIAQQNMIGVGMGLSCRRKIAFCSSFSAFLTRAADQIRIAGIGGNPIKIVGSHSGCSIGEDGPSQMALEDLGFFRNLPNGVVIAPSDGVSMLKAVQLIANYNDGPSYIRTSRPDVPIIYQNNQQFQIEKIKTIKQSPQDRLVILTHGVIVHQCLKVYQNLLSKNIKVRVIDLFCLKPLDGKQIRRNIKQCKGVVFVAQDHYEAGGAYQAICGVAQGEIRKIRHLCVRTVPGSAKPHEQLALQGLDAESIQKSITQFLEQN